MENAREWFETWFDSPYYHVLYEHRDEGEAARFVHALAGLLSIGRQDRVLDLACGAGRHAAMLAAYAGRVIGLDLSPKSIDQASKNHMLPNLEFHIHDMRRVYRVNYFHYIFNFFTSFGYFRHRHDNQKVMDAAYSGLRPGGQMLIDFMNAGKVIDGLVPSETVTRQDIDFNIKREVSEGRILKHIQFEVNGTRHSYTESVQALMPEELCKLAGGSGLEVVAQFGDHGLSRFDPQSSPRYILLLRKPGTS